MFDLQCTAPEAIELSSKGLISQRLSYGQEYLIVVDPFKFYLKDHIYTITIDNKTLMSDNDVLLKDTVIFEDCGHRVPILAKLINRYYYWDRTVLHVILTAFKNDDFISNFEPLSITTLKSMDGVMDKMYRNELLPKHMRLTKEERDKKVPFNVITRSENVAKMSFKSLDISIPANDISQLLDDNNDISTDEGRILIITEHGLIPAENTMTTHTDLNSDFECEKQIMTDESAESND